MTARMVDTDGSLVPIDGAEPVQVPDISFFAHPQSLASGGSYQPVTGTVVGRRALFDRLAGASRVTQITAPPGSGKTMLVRSWIGEAGLAERAGWVSVQRQERDAQRFWISVIEALGATAAGSTRVRGLTPAPDLDGWAIVERLLEDLGSLEGPVWLVIDDLHELRSTEALSQLELLVMRSPAQLRFVLVTRHDQWLGLHRLRLDGGLTEIRAADLRFTLAEARALLDGGGVRLSEAALAQLVERTEGWAAGLRLAALSLAGHPQPDRFAAEFSGSERTVAEYLLVEVLDRQPEPVRRLLLRTSVLDRVNGPLADVLTEGVGGERILQDLEEANAFIVSLDARRIWFRYHRLFADLLQLELRRTTPAELPGLHAAAATWYAEHGQPVDAVRHAQKGGHWGQAAGLLADHWFGLYLDGRAATLHDLLTGFPAGAVEVDAELAVLMASDQALRGSIEAAEGYLVLATREAASVSANRRSTFQLRLAILRLSLARQRSDLPAVVEETQALLALAEAPDTAQLGLGDQLRALALISLGAAQLWTARLDEAERHLARGLALAHRIERPFLEIAGLGLWAMVAAIRSSFTLAAQRSGQAIELARRHGWAEESTVAVAYAVQGYAMVGQGRLEDAEPWLDRAERALRVEVEPAAGLLLRCARGGLELARGRDQAALRAFRAAEALAELLVVPHALATGMRGHLLQLLVRVGEPDRAERAFAELDDQDRESGEMRTALAALQLALDNPEAATVALAPVLDRTVPVAIPHWLVQAFLLEGIARDALGETPTADSALERALDLAEPDGVVYPFLLHPAPGLLARHSRHHTSHASLVAEILNLLAGGSPAPSPGEPEPLRESLSDSEKRILRYLPTHLSAPEIAGELYLSVHTVKSHMYHLYAKLGTHKRAETVARARVLGLLAPSSRQR
ncbi:MAG TPA: LuxR C-terminal-related transcriptional regulator [Pseudonocardiaceae bacterium]|jgi:LuxR family maltose regulon positive regulatory protein|nr:LuxR C-terminal-related transcriptional regulator [Pseudonocardiaceae bacterium]